MNAHEGELASTSGIWKGRVASGKAHDLQDHGLSEALQEGRGGLYMSIHARPGAKRTQLRGLHGGALKVAVKEAALNGKANSAIIRLVAQKTHLSRADIVLVSGQASRRKRLFLQGDLEQLRRTLATWLESSLND